MVDRGRTNHAVWRKTTDRDLCSLEVLSPYGSQLLSDGSVDELRVQTNLVLMQQFCLNANNVYFFCFASFWMGKATFCLAR